MSTVILRYSSVTSSVGARMMGYASSKWSSWWHAISFRRHTDIQQAHHCLQARCYLQ